MTYEKQTHIHTNNTHTHTLLFYFYFDNFTQRNVRDDFYDCIHLKMNIYLFTYVHICVLYLHLKIIKVISN